MFDDLVPPAPADVGTAPPIRFDDLVPPTSTAQPAMTAQQRYRQTLKAYHDQGTENPDDVKRMPLYASEPAPGYVSPETSKAFAEDKANIPKLGEKWGNVGTGAAKGLAGGLFGGFVGDIESFGRLPFQIPGVREYIADVSPHTVIPTSEEGGYLGPRGFRAFKAPETPEEKGGVSIGSLLTPFAATAPLKALRGASKLSSSAAEIVNAAERQGISIPRAAVTDNREIQTAAGYLKEIPFVGTPLVKASEKALSEIEDVAGRTVSALGSGNKLRAGDIASDAIEGWITGKSKTIATELYDAVDPLVNPEFTRPLFETKKVANEIAAKRANAKISGDSPAIREIEDALASPGMNYDGVKDLRTYIRDMTPQEMVAKNINKGEAKRIYDALTSDLRATVLDAGGPDALKKFDKANDVYNIIADRRASIAKVIGVSADAAPEKVIDRITAMAGNAGSADYQTLQKVRKSIGPKSWDEVSSAILAKMGRANPEAAFSADQFVTAWNKLSPSSKQLLFNSTNRPGIINDLNDLVTLSSAQKNLSKYANPSGSGRLATFGSMILGAWAAPLTTIATIVGGRQMAKFFASPIAVKSTAQWAKANNAAFTTPNITTTAKLLSASDNIAKTLNREFGGNFSAKDFITPGQGKEPSRATGGSVFDKMHAAKHMQEGGGLSSFLEGEYSGNKEGQHGGGYLGIESPTGNAGIGGQGWRENTPEGRLGRASITNVDVGHKIGDLNLTGSYRANQREIARPPAGDNTYFDPIEHSGQKFRMPNDIDKRFMLGLSKQFSDGGSVFDKMHAAKHMQQGGGLESFIKSLGSQGAAFGTQTEQEQAGFQRDPISELGKGAYNDVEHLAKENIDNANLLATGNRDQFSGKPGFEASMLTMGTGAVAGVPMRAGEAVLGAGPIRAYHGSPHDFDKFDLAKIGTGEGAQAYGHGLYFAENEGIARNYRDALASRGAVIGGKPINTFLQPDIANKVWDTEARAAGISDEVRKAVSEKLDSGLGGRAILNDLTVDFYGEKLDDVARILQGSKGRMYEVNINAHPDHFLDWDKPLSGQLPDVQAKIGKVARFTQHERDNLPIRAALEIMGSPKDYSAKMHAAGIPGIKYLDQGSRQFSADAFAGVQRAEAKIERLRASGETGYKLDDALQELQSAKRSVGDLSSNYVVFDPKIIEIMKKYGMTIPAATAAYEAMKTNQEKTGFKKGGSVFDKMKRASK